MVSILIQLSLMYSLEEFLESNMFHRFEPECIARSHKIVYLVINHSKNQCICRAVCYEVGPCLPTQHADWEETR
jgi:hypothetical protein